MTSSPKRPDRAVQQLVADAERAFDDGESEVGRAFLHEAATFLVTKGDIDGAIDLWVTWREYARAARIAQQANDHGRAAQLLFRAGDLGGSAQSRLANGEPLIAAELFERSGKWLEAAEIYENLGDLARASQIFERGGEKKHAADLLVRALTGQGARRLVGAEASESCRRAGVLYSEVGHTEMAVRVLRWGGQGVFAGRLLAEAGQTTEAIRLLVEAGDLLGAAEVARSRGDLEEAHRLLAQRAEKEGRLPEAAAHREQAGEHAEAARLYESLQAYDRAAPAYERAGRYEIAGHLYERLGSIEDAVRCFRAGGRDAEAKALADGSHRSDDSIRRALASGDLLGAASAVVALARRGHQERYAEAIAYLEQVRPDRPTYFEARTLLGEILAESGNTKKALSVFQQLFIGATPRREHVPATYRYGRLLEAEGFLAGARNAYRTIASFDIGYRDVEERLRFLRESDQRVSSGIMAPPSTTAIPRVDSVVRGVPTLPMVVGGPAPIPRNQSAPSLPPLLDRSSVPLLRHTSRAMTLFDRELRALSEDLEAESASPLSPTLDPPADLAPTPIPMPTPVSVRDSGATEPSGGTLPALPPDNLLGMVLRGRFRIERKLGAGAQAQVYLARDQVLDREVAIKVLSEQVAEDRAALERFLREARLAARVHHQCSIAIFDFGEERGLTFMAMEFFKGRTLRDVVKRGPIDPKLALKIARDVASALGAVHEAGIVHRDVKPTNVMVDKTGNVRLTDFGVARGVKDDTGTGLMVGTMKYMAPEQARGKEVDQRVDLFSLGVVLFEMLTGKAPFGSTLDALIDRVTKPPPELPPTADVPELVRTILKRCLARKPSGRYPNTSPLIDDLTRAIRALDPSRSASGRTKRKNSRSRPASVVPSAPRDDGNEEPTQDGEPAVEAPVI